jgi:hypothetical protein
MALYSTLFDGFRLGWRAVLLWLVLGWLLMKDLEAGKWYANVHTADNKGGEIRGQMVQVQ